MSHEDEHQKARGDSADGDVSPLTSRKVSMASPATPEEDNISNGQQPARAPSAVSPGRHQDRAEELKDASAHQHHHSIGLGPLQAGVSSSYRGFHHASIPSMDIHPPFQHPVKPRTKRSLFGKFINSLDKSKRGSNESSNSDESNMARSNGGSVSSASSSRSPTSMASFSGPSTGAGIPQAHNTAAVGAAKPVTKHSDASGLRRPSFSTAAPGTSLSPSPVSPTTYIYPQHIPSISTSVLSQGSSVVALSVNDLTDMSGIVADPAAKPKPESEDTKSLKSSSVLTPPTTASSQPTVVSSSSAGKEKESWTAPESWDVKNYSKAQIVSDEDEDFVIRKTFNLMPQFDELKLDNKNYHIRIHGEDDNFSSTLKRPFNETVEELINYLKGRYSLVGDYKLSLRIGKVTKKLEPNQRPIKIQTNLLLLSGYVESDRLDEVGRDDLSYLFRFILHHDILKQLSPPEEEYISRDLVHVNLKSKDLQKIPALCYSSKVQSLDVSNNGDITLPSDFFQTGDSQLSSLRMVNIRAKNFPPNIVYGKELISLDLERNFISVIPDNISLLKSLSILTLRCNKIRELPANLPQTLKILDISSNDFETFPESVNNLPNLLQLDISYNKLKTLPSSINNLKSIKKINLSSNSLKIVDINLKNLRTLNLKYNEILELHLNDCNIENLYLTDNKISNITDPLNSLKVLDLDQNPITQLNFISKNLSSLILSNAKLTSLPKVILSLEKLEKLNLSKNGLRELPAGISKLTNLKELSIFSNNLESLPDLSKLVKLKFLDIHDNNLRTIQDFSFIENVNISSNLIREFPSNMKFTNHLKILRASDNKLNDSCLHIIKNFINLKNLSLSYNRLMDIPNQTIGSLISLEQLFLSGNHLTALPDDIGNLSSLKVLYLNGNRFRTLPSDLSQLRGLEVVDVGSNDLKYNTSNSKYEWNWNYNINLKNLNLSGNKKLEISEDLNLPKLKMLGLMDLTLTTQYIPDESMDIRVRTTPSQLGNNLSYGISDRVNKYVTARDSVFEQIDGGILIGLFDGIYSGKISYIIKENFHKIFEKELKKNDIVNSLRQTFLSLNKVINSSDLNSEDGLTGSSATVLYIKDKKVYTANIGDTSAILAKTDGSISTLTVEHYPSAPLEFERIRTSGGFVSNNDKLDGVAKVSRAAGFTDLLPHIHSAPDITEANFHDEVLVIGTKELFDYLPLKTVGDIVREDDNPMITAERLRDYAIAYGCDSKCTAIVLSSIKAKKKPSNVVKTQVEDSNLRRLKPEIEPPTGEVAMVFTDIKNSTSLWENFPLAMRSAIRTHNEIMRRQLHIVGGYEVKTEGDAFMVSFPTITSGLIWCFNVQQQLLLEDWPSEIIQSDECQEIKDQYGNVIYKGVSVRMGIHWGLPVCEPDIITRRMDYFGPMVNKTARVCAVADGGEIALTYDCVQEFKRIEQSHKLVEAGVSIKEAYGGNELCESLDHEFEIIQQIGWKLALLGKVQLKGLETEEEISLLFPKQLETRLGFQRKIDLSADDLYKLRAILIRLEYLLSIVTGQHSSTSSVKLKNELSEKVYFEIFISRVENVVALLKLKDDTVGLLGENRSVLELVSYIAEVFHSNVEIKETHAIEELREMAEEDERNSFIDEEDDDVSLLQEIEKLKS